jgi:glycosyltransferase involved in cell wall biosynthesis
MTTPVVSVVMLTHNREKYVGEAIVSVLHQEFANLELIILDDGSTDGTEQVIQGFKDSRIRYYRFSKTGEISRLRNTGIQHSNGQFIAFIDSDDIWSPEKLTEQLDLFKKYPQSGFGLSDVIEFQDQGSVMRSGIYERAEKETEFAGNIFLSLVQSRYPIYPSTVIFKKECLDLVGIINKDLKSGETEFFTRLAYAYDCFISYKTLVKIRKHEGNSSEQLRTEAVDEMQFCLGQLRAEGKISHKLFRKMTAWYHYVGGIVYNDEKLYHKARREFVLCVRQEPFHVKAWIRILLTFIPMSL